MTNAFWTGFCLGVVFCLPTAIIFYAIGYDQATKAARKLRRLSFERN